MTDHRARPAADVEVEAIATVGSVLTDLVEVSGRIPVRHADQAEPIARILDRLAEEISEAAGMIRWTAGSQPGTAPRPGRRIDGSVPAGGDERVIQARILLAEHRQPLTMTPADLRKLLTRYQQCVRELLEVTGSPADSEHEHS
jgi:hypothetical protein